MLRLLSRSTLQKLALAFLVWTVIEAHLIYYRIARVERETKAQAVLREPPRIFIASLHWNNEKILRSEWNKGVLALVDAFGPENTFVSVYESGSWDDSKGALRELDQALEKTGVGKKIVLDEATHEDLVTRKPAEGEEGWITLPGGGKALRRIPYLSRLRNLSLQPLLDLAENGTTFNHVLFLGDVVFSVCCLHCILHKPSTANNHPGSGRHCPAQDKQGPLRRRLLPGLQQAAPLLRHVRPARCPRPRARLAHLALLPRIQVPARHGPQRTRPRVELLERHRYVTPCPS